MMAVVCTTYFLQKKNICLQLANEQPLLMHGKAQVKAA
jgi:hypothetical protein